MFIHDSSEKTVRIPVKIREGKVTYFYGNNMPGIAEGTIGRLILPASSITDEKFLARVSAERIVIILPEGTVILAEISCANFHDLSSEHKAYLSHIHGKYFHFLREGGAREIFVDIVLKEPLRLVLRGTKTAQLCDCRCLLPLLKQEAESVNHAYALISTELETKRRSHSANIFRKVRYRSSNERWQPLEYLRNEFEAEDEKVRFGKPESEDATAPSE